MTAQARARTKAAPKAPKKAPALAAVPDDGVALSTIDREITETKQAKAKLDVDYRSARNELAGRLSRLESARKTLLRAGRPARGPLVAARQAGAKNIERVEAAAKKKLVATQVELAALSGVGTGSMTWAIRALEEQGKLRATGERRDGSRVFEYIPKRSRTLKPGE